MTPPCEILVTGMGVVTPLGVGLSNFWNGLLEGASGVGVRPEFAETDWPFRLAARVQNFDPRQMVKPRKALKVMCGPIQQGCAAANLAFEQSGLQLEAINPDRIATVFGTEIFLADPTEMVDAFSKCVREGRYEHRLWGSEGISQIEPLWMLKYLPNMVASHISIALDARGPSNSICQGDASSLLSIIEAAELIRRGWADVAVAGGTGSNIQMTCMLYRGGGHLSHRVHEPQKASRPFDRSRDGSVPGEGAAAIVLENAESVDSRNGTALARLAGWAQGFCPIPDPRFAGRVAEVCAQAIERAGIDLTAIGQFNAHGVSTQIEDRLESTVIERLTPNAQVMALKHNFGNLGPGGGGVELIGGILGMNAGLIPGAINFEEPDPGFRIKLSQSNVPIDHQNLLKLSFSSTGQIAAVVVSKCR